MTPQKNPSFLQAAGIPDSEADQERWFATEVQPHESTLKHWLQSRFPTLSDIDDVVQESYIRLIRARNSGRIKKTKPYLFTTARNAALNLFRHHRKVVFESLVTDEAQSVMEDGPGTPETLIREQELELLRQAIASLPPRCRAIMILQRFHDLPNAEIASRLGLSINTVNAQVVIGLLRCRNFFRAREDSRNALKSS